MAEGVRETADQVDVATMREQLARADAAINRKILRRRVARRVLAETGFEGLLDWVESEIALAVEVSAKLAKEGKHEHQP